MDLGSVQSVAENLFRNLLSSELKEILSKFGYKSEFEDLQLTVITIFDVFRNLETKQELTLIERDWTEELKHAVFEANDLFDEFVTLARKEAHGWVSKKATRSNKISQAFKYIKKKLDDIASKYPQFVVKIGSKPIKEKRRLETCSYVNESDIIGREYDLESIVGTLLASNNDQPALSFLTIVGMGGLGKTALAQLIYNDPRVKSAFPLRVWTCVDDQDQKELDVNEILGKILTSSANRYQKGSPLKEVLEDRKFLLVLDDVWTERSQQWCELIDFLRAVARASWIVVTTRSQNTATIIGGSTYELQGLSEDDSWRLFEKTAFGPDQSNPLDELVKIGRDIVDGCVGLPLAIRVAGCLLFGQEKSKWESLQKTGLGCVDDVICILKRSFDNLEHPLKCCFNYFAMFPKGFEIDKEVLLSLWMAHGYIITLDYGQSIEEDAEEYFGYLFSRYFFQDIKKDKYGEIASCRLHPLMHDVACNSTNNEMCIANTISDNPFDMRVRHVSLVGGGGYTNYTLGNTKIYSFLHVGFNGFRVGKVEKYFVESLMENCSCLRALDLSGLVMDSLPESIGKLLHLRYLNLSGNTELEVLPKSITELINLQSLELMRCHALKELPEDMRRLVCLMKLDIRSCYSLTCMPTGMGELASLHRLSDFIVGGQGSYSSWNQWFGGLEDLKTLCNLKGCLNIQIRWPKNEYRVVKEDGGRKESYMTSKEFLKPLCFISDMRRVL